LSGWRARAAGGHGGSWGMSMFRRSFRVMQRLVEQVSVAFDRARSFSRRRERQHEVIDTVGGR